MKYELGQTMWYVPFYGAPGLVTVTKVGHKWVELGNPERPRLWCQVGTDSEVVRPQEKGRSSPGTIWASKEVWEAHVASQVEWVKLRKDMGTDAFASTGASVEDIAAARKLLRL